MLVIRRAITIGLLYVARITATTSAARYYIKTAIDYEDIL